MTRSRIFFQDFFNIKMTKKFKIKKRSLISRKPFWPQLKTFLVDVEQSNWLILNLSYLPGLALLSIPYLHERKSRGYQDTG